MWLCNRIRIIKGWEPVGDKIQLKMDSIVCGLVWCVVCVRS